VTTKIGHKESYLCPISGLKLELLERKKKKLRSEELLQSTLGFEPENPADVATSA
jgi:hypothetical protein